LTFFKGVVMSADIWWKGQIDVPVGPYARRAVELVRGATCATTCVLWSKVTSH